MASSRKSYRKKRSIKRSAKRSNKRSTKRSAKHSNKRSTKRRSNKKSKKASSRRSRQSRGSRKQTRFNFRHGLQNLGQSFSDKLRMARDKISSQFQPRPATPYGPRPVPSQPAALGNPEVSKWINTRAQLQREVAKDIDRDVQKKVEEVRDLPATTSPYLNPHTIDKCKTMMSLSGPDAGVGLQTERQFSDMLSRAGNDPTKVYEAENLCKNYTRTILGKK